MKKRSEIFIDRANTKERNFLTIGYLSIILFVVLVGKFIIGSLHLFTSLVFIVAFSFVLRLYVEKPIKIRLAKLEKNKRAMNLYLGSYKKQKESYQKRKSCV